MVFAGSPGQIRPKNLFCIMGSDCLIMCRTAQPACGCACVVTFAFIDQIMTSTISSAPAVFDPFHYEVELPYEIKVYAQGFPMRVVTNSLDVIRTVEESWSGFPQLFYDHSLEFRVVVSDDQNANRPSTMVSRVHKHLITTTTDEKDFTVGDLDRGIASFWISPASARDREFLRSYHLHNMMYIMLWHGHMTMVHAACVARNGRGILLCGVSGAGKSCLSFACARRGWTFITDDGVSLARRSEKRMVVGTPREMRFRPTAVDVLPELEGHLTLIKPWNKFSFHPPKDAFPEFHRELYTYVDAVVFLNRPAGGPATLVPMSSEEAFARLDRELPMMEQIEDQRASLLKLVEARSYELRYTDLHDAINTLESLVS